MYGCSFKHLPALYPKYEHSFQTLKKTLKCKHFQGFQAPVWTFYIFFVKSPKAEKQQTTDKAKCSKPPRSEDETLTWRWHVKKNSCHWLCVHQRERGEALHKLSSGLWRETKMTKRMWSQVVQTSLNVGFVKVSLKALRTPDWANWHVCKDKPKQHFLIFY